MSLLTESSCPHTLPSSHLLQSVLHHIAKHYTLHVVENGRTSRGYNRVGKLWRRGSSLFSPHIFTSSSLFLVHVYDSSRTGVLAARLRGVLELNIDVC